MSLIRTLGGIAAAAPPVVGGFPANTKHQPFPRDSANRMYVDGGDPNNALRAEFNGKTAVTVSVHIEIGPEVSGDFMTLFLAWAGSINSWCFLGWNRGKPGDLWWDIQDSAGDGQVRLAVPGAANVGYDTASHIVADCDLPTGAANVYINDMATPAGSGTLNTISAFSIGVDQGGAGIGSYPYRNFGNRGMFGYACQVGIWDRVLNQTERELLYTGADAISVPVGCMGAWRVDGDGDYSVDDSGNGNYLTKLGNQDLIATIPPPYI